MTQRMVQSLVFDVVCKFFAGATIIWSNQDRAAIPKNPLICLTAGNLKRSRFPAVRIIDGIPVSTNVCSLTLTIDLFTNGREVIGSEQRENTAVEDMLSFVDYLDSQYVADLLFDNGVTISLESDVLDLSEAIYDANYEFRSQIALGVSFVHESVGYAGTTGEETVKTVEITETDPDTGEQVTVDTEEYIDLTEPFEPSASGGNTEELARNTDCGYFTSAEIKHKE